MRAPQILVVEDSNSDFCLIEMILQECLNPPRLKRAVDGEEAMTLLHQATLPMRADWPDLVILDINLPRVNGLEILEFVKSQEFIRDIPVVMFTSSTNARDKAKALDLGASEFLTKPLSLDLMTALLNDVCAKYLAENGGSANA
jgi:chemotaxis family two-component system response regulator Rcp1